MTSAGLLIISFWCEEEPTTNNLSLTQPDERPCVGRRPSTSRYPSSSSDSYFFIYNCVLRLGLQLGLCIETALSCLAVLSETSTAAFCSCCLARQTTQGTTALRTRPDWISYLLGTRNAASSRLVSWSTLHCTFPSG